MTVEERWTEVDRYFSERLLPDDPVLQASLAASNDAGLPEISVSPNQGKLLEILARISGASSVLEIGTLAGYSTIWLARGLAAGGRIITIEIDPKHATVARSNFKRAGLTKTVELIEGSALDILPHLAKEKRGPFDIIFIDADKQNIPAYYDWSLKLSGRGSLIIVDNVVRDGRVIDSATDDPGVMGVRRFIDVLSAEKQLNATAIQTVGIKGYDGFAIILR